MGIGAMLLAGVVIGAIAFTVIVLARLTIKKLKELIQKRKEKNAKQKVAFGKTHKILDQDAKKMLQDAPTVSMSDLEAFCDENPYFVVNCDSNQDNVDDFEVIKTGQVEDRVDSLIKDRGIIVFE